MNSLLFLVEGFSQLTEYLQILSVGELLILKII